jgi:hypothetical protein
MLLGSGPRLSASRERHDTQKGEIDSYRGDPGLLMNLADPNEAHELLEKVPLGQAGMMEFELIPLGPIKPLGLLLSETP